MEIIKLEGITKVYRTTEVETTALENVNLTVRKGEFLSIMGPSFEIYPVHSGSFIKLFNSSSIEKTDNALR